MYFQICIFLVEHFFISVKIINPFSRELFMPFARSSTGSSIIFFSVLDVLYVPVLLILCLYCKLQILVPVCHLSVLLISAMVSGFQPQLEMFSLPRVC